MYNIIVLFSTAFLVGMASYIIFIYVSCYAMTDYKLNNIDLEDIEDLLAKVEKSFNIKFVGNKLAGLSTFGELCDHITKKIELDHSDNCTTQRAFYKLRNAISSTLNIDNVKTDTLFADILPRQNRLCVVRQIENKLGFKFSFLRPTHFVSGDFNNRFTCLNSRNIYKLEGWTFRTFIFNTGTSYCKKIGKETELKTFGKLTKKITKENYLQSTRNSITFNKNEIENILKD